MAPTNVLALIDNLAFKDTLAIKNILLLNL
jgi:hypothetical protein